MSCMSGQPRVCVFAPAPLLTVTIEQPSSDRGDGEVHLHPGGQGFWIARLLTASTSTWWSAPRSGGRPDRSCVG